MKKELNMHRKGCRDIWNGFMCEGAVFSGHDIPLCPTTAKEIPKNIITWVEAKQKYNNHFKDKDYYFKDDCCVCFYIDDYKFDGRNGVWNNSGVALKILKHFSSVITPDFSTYQDFPEPIKFYNTYRMRAFGYWLGKNDIKVINNIRWGTEETYAYCFDGVPKESMVAIGTVGGSPRREKERERFEEGLYRMVNILKPKIIIVYGSSSYQCFDVVKSQGVEIVSYEGSTAAYFRRKLNEQA